MAEKRYYWLKFKEDFFDFKGVKKLRKLAGGDTYVIIYLKMLLRSLKTDGILEYTGIEKDFAAELALDLDEDPENVSVVLAIITGCGMCEYSDASHIFLPYVGENTGSETAAAQRWRDWKKRQDDAKALDSNTPLTLPQRTANAEKEIDIDIENRDKSKRENILPHPEARGKEKKPSKPRTFIPPTLEQIEGYVKEANLNIDPVQFYTYFTTPNDAGQTWIDSMGKPVKNWKQKMQTWNKMGWGTPKAQPTDRYANLKKLMEETPDD